MKHFNYLANKRVAISLFCLTFSYCAIAQKLTQGSLDFLTTKKTVIEVRWDFSQTKFNPGNTLDKFLPREVTQEDWENDVLQNSMHAFITSINEQTCDYNMLFSTKSDEAQYEMIIAPISLNNYAKHNATYTIKEKSTNEIKAVIENKESGSFEYASMKSLLPNEFGKAGSDVGRFLKKSYSKIFSSDNRLKSYLKNVRVLNYRFDYSQSKVEGIDFKEYITMSLEDDEQDEEAFRKYTKKVEFTFISSANKNSLVSKGYKLDNKEDSPCEVVISPTSIDKDGAHIIIGVIVDKASQEEVARLRARVGAGRYNDFTVLFIENLEVSGERFGDKLADDILDKANGKN